MCAKIDLHELFRKLLKSILLQNKMTSFKDVHMSSLWHRWDGIDYRILVSPPLKIVKIADGEAECG